MYTHFNPLHQNTAQREAASATLPNASGKMSHATISELTMPHTGVVQSEAATNSMVKQNNLMHGMTMSTARVGDTVPLDNTSQSPPAASQLPVHSTTHDANATALDLTMAKTGTVHPEGRPDSMVKHHNPLHETSPAAEIGTGPFDTMYYSPPAASQLPAHSATQGKRAQAADVTVSALTMPNTGAPHMLIHPSEMALQPGTIVYCRQRAANSLCLNGGSCPYSAVATASVPAALQPGTCSMHTLAIVGCSQL